MDSNSTMGKNWPLYTFSGDPNAMDLRLFA